MKNLTLILSTLLVSAAAQADGFVCSAFNADLNVKVYNKTNPGEGTRTPSIMILSNPSVSDGRKTIATFSKSNASLVGSSTNYLAFVNLAHTESARAGELIAGTKLGYVSSLLLEVDYNYSQPIANGDAVEGVLTITKLNGERIPVALECVRYLKGE